MERNLESDKEYNKHADEWIKEIAQVVKIATLFVLLSYVAFKYGNNQTLVHGHCIAIA